MNDFFADTDFKTSSKTRHTQNDLLNLDSAGIRRLIESDYGGKLVSHPINGEFQTTCGILAFLLRNGDIKSIASKAKTDKSPAMARSELEIYGAAEQIIDSYPEAYCTAVTDYGKKVLEQLSHVIALNDQAVGADGTLGKMYALLWKKLPPPQRNVGADDEKAKKDESALALGYHCDQTKKIDPTNNNTRAVNAFGKDFNVDRKLVVVWIDKKGKKTVKSLGTISDKVQGNHTYYFTHRGAGRAAIGQTYWDGCPAVLVVMHQVWLEAVHKNCPRGIFVQDIVFPNAEAEATFLAMVNSNNEAVVLPEGFNNVTKLYNDLVAVKPELGTFVKGEGFCNDVLAVIDSNDPLPNDYNIQCFQRGCSGNASALDLRRHRGHDKNLSGAKLLEYLRANVSKEDIVNNRAICGDCANCITNKAEVVTNLCLKCCLDSKVGKLAQCGNCREYRCVGYDDENGNRSFECRDVGIKLDNNNIACIGYAICVDCNTARERKNKRARASKKRAETNQDEKDDLDVRRMTNMFELYDDNIRKLEENKQYVKGAVQIAWDAACHEETNSMEMKSKFQTFKRGHKDIRSLEAFNAYIRSGGAVCHAAKVQAGANQGKKNRKSR
jgi:hypothetical protein